MHCLYDTFIQVACPSDLQSVCLSACPFEGPTRNFTLHVWLEPSRCMLYNKTQRLCLQRRRTEWLCRSGSAL